MLLLHHNPDGAPGRTRTDEYEFTKLALWLLEARGRRERQNDEGEIPTSRLRFPKWRSHVDLHHEPPPSQSGVQNSLHLESKLASVAGLAPARTSLKGWLRELLCIHGLKSFAAGVGTHRVAGSLAGINPVNPIPPWR